MNRLDEIKARMAKATEGPWYDIPNPVWKGAKHRIDSKICNWGNYGEIGYIDTPFNAAFIAHSRDDIPFLVAEVERLEHEIEGWRNKWECAVDMAARAENEVERLRAALAEEMEISRARKAVADALEEK